MQPRATVEILEQGSSRVVAVPRTGLTIGRDPSSALLLGSRSVSAHHAELYWHGDDLYVRDLQSSFGTRRDGAPIRVPTLLADGDELVLGGAAVLHVSLLGAGRGDTLGALADDEGLVATALPVDARPSSIDLVPLVSAFLGAELPEDLAHRIVSSSRERFEASRGALLQLIGKGDRFRVLAVDGARDATFVSRTVVDEAARRGVARYATEARREPLASVVRSGAKEAIAAGIRPQDGQVRVLYLDALAAPPPDGSAAAPSLGWGDALSLQLIAAHAASAYDALAARVVLAEDRRRFDQLRRYFSPSVVEHILSGGAEALERPQSLRATVLFADLVGYTALSERLERDLERLFAILNRWLDAGARAVLGHGGTLDKFIGDAVMGVFGAPLPLAEAELAAVRCALEMRDTIAAIGADVAEPLQITVGINSGDVLAGSVGSRRRLEYTVLGDTVNVAARLQGRAHANEILVGPGTAERLGSDVELVEAGDLELKNHASVRAYRVLRLRA